MTVKAITPKEDNFGHHDEIVKGEKKKRFPHLRLEHEFFPIAKKWIVGEEYHVLLKLKQTGISISRFDNSSEFDIIGADMNAKKNTKHNTKHGSAHEE